jgi:hypothetical protein
MLNRTTGKPIGTFRCPACEKLWDGSQLYFDPPRLRWTCGNLFCGCNVSKVSDEPYTPDELAALAGTSTDGGE